MTDIHEKSTAHDMTIAPNSLVCQKEGAQREEEGAGGQKKGGPT